jgi:hypothetical protein
MANSEHINMLLHRGVDEWNKWRSENFHVIPDFINANLIEANLIEADLRFAEFSGADLKGAQLRVADLTEADLTEADLSGAYLNGAYLPGAKLSRAYLKGAQLSEANLSRAYLSEANLSEANLILAKLSRADLTEADLSGAELSEANLNKTDLSGANLGSATIGWTSFGDVDLSVVKGLDTVEHRGPSTIGIDTLQKSKGDIPEDFLRSCGMSPWEIEIARLYDMALTPVEISDILDENIFRARTEGPIYIGGIFISYSHDDSKFVDKLYEELKESGASVWLDRHDLLAGPLEKQIVRALRIQDIVIIVLSKNSIESDWVENELEMARKKEKDEGREVLCPIALDDSWKKKVEGDVLWRQLKKKNILDFSSWQTEKFNSQFKKLLDGIKINYEKRISVPKKSAKSV